MGLRVSSKKGGGINTSIKQIQHQRHQQTKARSGWNGPLWRQKVKGVQVRDDNARCQHCVGLTLT
jgi:hypothetical protein